MGKTRLTRAVMALLAVAGLLAMAGPVAARTRMSFVPGRHGYTVASSHRGYGHRYGYGRNRRRAAGSSARPGRSRSAEPDEAPAAAAPPGSGFKMEDGVLTYPAPERFQPKNLKHL